MPTLEELLDYEGPQPLGTIDDVSYYRLAIIVEVKTSWNINTLEPLCMADDWEKSLPARLIAEIVAHKHTRQELTSAEQRASVFEHDFKITQERASRVAWLESEVSRLTADLQRFREQEAAQRVDTSAFQDIIEQSTVRGTAYRDGEIAATYDAGKWTEAKTSAADNIIKGPKIYHQQTLDNQRLCDAKCRCSVTGVYTIDPCDCGHCSEARQAYQAMDRLNRPATNSHIAPEAPIFRKLCQCDACREIRIHSGYPAAEIEGH